MANWDDRRRWKRTPYSETGLGAAYGLGVVQPLPADRIDDGYPLFVTIRDLSPGGALIETSAPQNIGTRSELLVFSPDKGRWLTYATRAAWASVGLHENCLVGLEFLPASAIIPPGNGGTSDAGTGGGDTDEKILAEDIEFLVRHRMIMALPRPMLRHILCCLKRRSIAAGESLMLQGEPVRSLFLVQRGRLHAVVHDGKASRIAARLLDGDTIGEEALLASHPDKPALFSVTADTDALVWELPRRAYEHLASAKPDVRTLLTELTVRVIEASRRPEDRIVGRHIIGRRIGQDHRAIVFAGSHKTLGVPVVIKMLRHTCLPEDLLPGQLKREARALIRLSHECLAKVHDIVEQLRTAFIISEHLEGQTLTDVVARSGPLPIGRALRILDQACLGLQCAHDHGLVHGFLRPEAVTILSGDRIKIADAGLPAGGPEPLAPSPWTAPEVLAGGVLDIRADIYSLGVITWTMLSGRLPADELAAADPVLLPPWLPVSVQGLVAKALAPDPDHRWQSATELRTALGPLLKSPAAALQGNMTTLFLHYDEGRREALPGLIRQLEERAEELGLVLSADITEREEKQEEE